MSDKTKIKYKADKISKQIQAQDSTSSEDLEESEEFIEDIDFQPSRIRASSIPETGIYKTSEISKENYSKSLRNEPDEEEEEIDSSDFGVQNEDLINELDQLEEKESETINSLRKQQEVEQTTAEGVKSLQLEYSVLLALRLKVQPLLTFANQLPPASYKSGSPFQSANQDAEVSQLFQSLAHQNSLLLDQINQMKLQMIQHLDWESNEVGDNLMSIIAQTGQKIRLSTGMKKGQVQHQPIEEQISLMLHDKSTLIQSSRHKNLDVFGLDDDPEILDEFYNDQTFYHGILSDYVSEQKPKTKITGQNLPQKIRSKIREVNTDLIPKIQNFVAPTMVPIPDYADSLFRSIMK